MSSYLLDTTLARAQRRFRPLTLQFAARLDPDLHGAQNLSFKLQLRPQTMLWTEESFYFRCHLLFRLLKDLIFQRSANAASNVTATNSDTDLALAAYAAVCSRFRGRR